METLLDSCIIGLKVVRTLDNSDNAFTRPEDRFTEQNADAFVAPDARILPGRASKRVVAGQAYSSRSFREDIGSQSAQSAVPTL